MRVRVFAPAKVNLTLQVGRPRADGYHPLQSVVAFADIGDWVEAAEDTQLSLRIEGPFAAGLPSGESNLVMRAARALAQAGSCDGAGARLVLHKALPVASGIGGGSSDAAAALKALNALWGLKLDEARLCAIAEGLGADVPVCVGARAAYMTGVGERFEAVTLPPLPGVLVNLGAPLATPAVYRQFDAMGLGEKFSPAPAPAWRSVDDAHGGARALGNDLEPAAQALLGSLKVVRGVLAAHARARCVALSGSGATMFALTDTMDDARTLAADVRAAQPNWWVKAVCLGGLDAAAPDR